MPPLLSIAPFGRATATLTSAIGASRSSSSSSSSSSSFINSPSSLTAGHRPDSHSSPHQLGLRVSGLAASFRRRLFSTVRATAGSLPSQSRVLIVGGGVVGCSVAYHLGLLGWGSSTLLLESGQLGCGTTWHAAGLVGQVRGTSVETRLSGVYGSQLYAGLERETGVATGYRQTGSISIARTYQRLEALKRQASRAAAFGIEAHFLSPAEAGQRWPYMRTDDLAGALWLPGDGSITSTDLTAALAAGARQRGVDIRERSRVTGMTVQDGQVRRVQTDGGHFIAVDVVVNCAGQWARELGALAGVTVPLHSAEHYYIVTDRLTPAVPTSLPVLRDPDALTYYREWSGGLVMGGFERHAKPCFHSGVPHPFEFQLLPEDWEQFEPLMEGALHRVPLLATAGVRMVNGPESFTPDNRYILGESIELRHYYIAAGMNSSGIASAGGAGKALAEWIVAGQPTMDLTAVDVRRFSRQHANVNFLRDRTVETLGLHYAMPQPDRELRSARPMSRSPIHHRLAERGAVWGSQFGWELPNYFIQEPGATQPSVRPDDDIDSGTSTVRSPFDRPQWASHVRTEHLACRESVGLADLSASAKLLVQGSDALHFITRTASSVIPVLAGTVRSLLLNAAGGIEADVQLLRLSSASFLLLAGVQHKTRLADLLQRNVRDKEHVVITDVTSAYAVFAILGPHSTPLLRSCWPAVDESARAVDVGHMAEVSIGYSQALATRCVDMIGADGWLLLMSSDVAVSVFDEISRAATALIEGEHSMGGRLQLVGHYCLESVRVERGLASWGVELDTFTTPVEAQLQHLLRSHSHSHFDPSHSSAFTGQAALSATSTAPATRRLASVLVVDEAATMWGGEPVLRNGQLVGFVASAALCITHIAPVSGARGLAWLAPVDRQQPADEAWLEQQSVDWQVEITGKRYTAQVSNGQNRYIETSRTS